MTDDGRDDAQRPSMDKFLVEGFKLKWPVISAAILISLGAWGFLFNQSEKALSLAQDTRDQLQTCYVAKSDYQRDIQDLRNKMDMVLLQLVELNREIKK